MLRLRTLAFFALCAIAPAFVTGSLFAQNIFDDDPAASDSENAKPVTTKGKSARADDESKPVAKKKKRKGKKKKSKAASTAAADTTPKPDAVEYTPEELARQSYAWAPETTVVTLISEAPGIKAAAPATAIKPPAAAVETIEPRPAGQGFKLPEIPLTQVLIVAGFVILFLIYRFRVGRQIKRKKY